MEQFLEQDSIAMGMLGKQPICNLVYRPLTYVLSVEEAGKKVFYNLLTHEMISVGLSELDLPEIKNYLIENWYLVPKDHDDQQLVDECRAVMTLMDSWPKKIHVFYIFTTLDCNARCFYCFEKRMPGSNMTTDIATRVIEYIQEQADGEPVKITWFGGEPLFNYSIIDFITEGLRGKGIKFESNMISNGLLFDKVLINKAKKFWNLNGVQISLDGTSQFYKKAKAYITDIENPFEKVLQNIKILLKTGIGVSIRLNIGLYNYRDMQDLVNLLCEEFKDEHNVSIYINPLFEIKDYTKDQKEFMYDFIDELNAKLNLVFDKNEKKEFFDRIAISSCMASGRETVTILPDGKVGVCANDTHYSLIGDIYTKELDAKVREEFGRRFYREDKCRPCPLYPNCYIVYKCPIKDSNEGCEPISVQRQMKKIKEKMKIRCRLGGLGCQKGFTQ